MFNEGEGELETKMRLENMRHHSSKPKSKLVDFFLLLIAHKCQRNSGQQKQVFNQLNKGADGSISKDELVLALMKVTTSHRGNKVSAE